MKITITSKLLGGLLTNVACGGSCNSCLSGSPLASSPSSRGSHLTCSPCDTSVPKFTSCIIADPEPSGFGACSVWLLTISPVHFLMDLTCQSPHCAAGLNLLASQRSNAPRGHFNGLSLSATASTWSTIFTRVIILAPVTVPVLPPTSLHTFQHAISRDVFQ